MTTSATTEALLEAELEVMPVLCLALEQNAIPLIGRIALRNLGSEPLTDLTLELQLRPELGDPQRFALAGTVEPGDHELFRAPNFRAPVGRLREVRESEPAELAWRILKGEDELATGRADVALLPPNHWPNNAAPPQVLAAYVMPNEPAVVKVVQATAERLKALTGDSSLEGYQARSPERVAAMARAVYEALQTFELSYISSPPSFEPTGQKIRLPAQVLDEKLACCLDVATLFCAALEQMRLHPVLVLVHGHAYQGVWLEPDGFNEGVAVSAARLRNEIALGRLLVWDSSTAILDAKPPFEAAVAAARASLDRSAEFDCALDIHVLRRQPMRPLALRAAAGGFEDALGADGVAAGAPTIVVQGGTGIHIGGTGDAPTDVARRFARWQEHLLDLTMRNRLLNLGLTSKAVVPLMVPDPAVMEDMLAAGGKDFTVLPWPFDPLGERDFSLMGRAGLLAQLDGQLRQALARHQLLAPLPDVALAKALKEIDRASKTALEEGGAHTLYLAVGMLIYFESDASTTPRLAPLLLYPVQLIQDRVRRVYTLRWTGDDPVPNVTLVEKLKRDFGVDIGGILQPGADESGVDVPALFRAAREGIRRFERWEVREEAHLGLFSFTKFLMWKDLQDNRDELLKNEVVRHVASAEGRAFTQPVEAVPPSMLDANGRSVGELPCVVDADSTQLSAVASALAGRSFVLQGPPGTGKSQTITNMVAALLAAGKTVLFVSEKMAALDVVERRLRQVGLGDFCLELHSHASNKKTVVEGLRAAYQRTTRVGQVPWRERSAEIDALRDRLNAVTEAMHKPRPLGRTFHDVLGSFLTADPAPAVRIPFGDPAAWDAERWRTMVDAVAELAARAAQVEPVAGHAWHGTRPGPWQTQARTKLEALLGEVPPTIAAERQAREALWLALGLPVREDEAATDAAIAVLTAIADPNVPRAAFDDDWSTWRPQVDAWQARAEALAGRRARLAAAWEPGIDDPALEPVRLRLASTLGQPGFLRFFTLWGEHARLKPLAKGGLPDDATALAALEEARALREEGAMADAEATRLGRALGLAPGLDAGAMEAGLERGNDAVRAMRALAALGVPLGDGAARWRDLPTSLHASWPGAIQAWREARKQLIALDEVLREALGLRPGTGWASRAAAGWTNELAAFAARVLQGLGGMQAWCFYQAAVERLEAEGLGALATAHAAGSPDAGSLVAAFEQAAMRAWLDAVRDAEPALSGFFGPEHARTAERFRELDEAFRDLSRQYVVAKLEANLPNPHAAVDSGEPGILLREAAKRSRQMAVRTLLQKLPNLIFRLKPCFMMSPMSIAQYIPAGFKRFDVVIFDEASQIGTHDAIGAIARGNQVIVVGDSKQLPPTAFFQRKAAEDELPDENDVVEMESILDEAIVKQLPEQMLGWHYRSKHDALIAFSNKHYYDRRLTIFPPAARALADLGVKWHPVADGCYESGKSTNTKEAEALVAHLVDELRRTAPGSKTYGVVTFSMSQQTLILDLLEAARERFPEIDGHFKGLEPVFVKNLENVQGDERDVIYFSICYAEDAEKKLRMAFGPLSLRGGERRLNVAITRARALLRVFSTLRQEQIDLRRTASYGAAQLKEFLRYAAAQGSEGMEAASARQPEAGVARAVREALTGMGFEVHAEVGAGDYRVELAVVHPDRPGRYAIGIETDGRHYASGATARDRERIRGGVLRALGWKLTRVWSLDWWEDPAAQAQRLKAEIEAAIAAPEELPPPPPPPAPEPEAVTVELRAPAPSAPPPPSTPYVPVELPLADGGPDAFGLPAAGRVIRGGAHMVISGEGPVHEQLICRRVMASFGLVRMTDNTRRRIMDEVEGLVQGGKLAREGDFYLLATAAPIAGFRVGERDPEHWPPEEVANALAWVLASNLSLPRETAVREVARLFGLSRVGKNVAAAVDPGVERLVAVGCCNEVEGNLVWIGA